MKRELCSCSHDIAQEFGLFHLRTIHVFHDDQLHPYHFTRSALLFAGDCTLRLQFCEWLRHQHAADELLVCGHTNGVLRVRVFSVSLKSPFDRVNPHAICEDGYQVHFSVYLWADIIRDIVVGLNLLPDR